MHLVILGGGIIGLTTAYYAARANFTVTLIEKNSNPGEEATYANGAQLSYSHIDPLTSEYMRDLFRAQILQNNLALNIAPSAYLKQRSWLTQFYQHCGDQKHFNDAVSALAQIAKISESSFPEIKEHLNPQCSYQQQGTLHLFDKEPCFQRGKDNATIFTQHNFPGAVLSSKQIKKQFPDLTSKNIIGGVLYKKDAAADPLKFAQNLNDYLAKQQNVNLLYNHTIQEINYENTHISKVITNKQTISGDIYINCLGTNGGNLFPYLKKIIIPVQGYSVSYKPKPNTQPINIPALTDPAYRIVYSPLGDVIRIAGLLDIGAPKKIIKKRLEIIKNRACLFLPQLISDYEIIHSWVGIRPVTPDSLPIIGYSEKTKNLFYNIAHASLGWTLSAASAKITVENILKGNSIEEKFRPQRYNI